MPDLQMSRPIRFSAEQLWPDITKGTGIADLQQNGFQVWGAWKKDPLDNSTFLDNYKDGVNNSVFSATPVTYVNGTWSYITESEPEREWYRGYYSFAALPESAFDEFVQSATHTASVTVSDDVPTFTNQLALKFKRTIDLCASPDEVDFLCAFDCQDNSRNDAEVVTFDFKHVFARFGLEFFAYDPLKMPVVTNVKIYGNSRTINYGETYFLIQTKVQGSNIIYAQFDGVRSTMEEPYYEQSFDQDLFEIGITDSAVLCEKLVVFPENFTEEMPLYIDITYKKIVEATGDSDAPYKRYEISEDDYTYTINIKDVTWQIGETYTYKFAVDNLTGLQ